jgi:hypothetical protein
MALKASLKTHILQKLIDDFRINSGNSNFIFISRGTTWSNDSSAPTYVDNTESHNDLHKRLIAAKRITSTDAYLMIPKNSWSSGTTYSMYTDDDDMSGITFWATNSENNLYKCIYNGQTGGNTSGALNTSDSPRGTSNNVITTGDGYKWKFMYKVPENWGKFVTDDYIPVKKLPLQDGVSEKFNDERQLQYHVQYNAVNGAIDYIDINSIGTSYGNNINVVYTDANPDNPKTILRDAATGEGTTGTGKLRDGDSNTNDYYNSYSLNIVKGTGVGQYRRITDYDGDTKTVTVDNWTILPDTSSFFEIMPEVIIDGDGTGAVAKATCDGVTLSDVEVINKGSGFTRATATIKTTNTSGATLEPMLSPYGGHGSDPISEIPPTRLMILAKLDRDESGITSGKLYSGSFPLRNDFRQYGIIRNPTLATGDNKGKIAGSEIDSVTDIKISAATGSVYGAGDFVENDIVFGESSVACGKVLHWFRDTDISKGTLRLLNVGTKFKVGEYVVGLGTGSNWSSNNKGSGYVQYQDETDITQTNNHYRLTTALEIRSTAGNSGDTYGIAHSNRFDLDQIIMGSSGSSATIIEYIPSGGQTATLYLSNIVGSSGADYHGFTVGENLSGVTVSSVINKIYIPEFNKGSGQLLYINNVTPVSRHNEQEEEIKIIIDI